jgi:hypothetical protein
MPSTYAAVSTRMWNANLRRCSVEARLVRAYIATCPGRTTEGLFPLPLGYANADTGLSEEVISGALVELQEAHIIEWDPNREMVLDLEALEVANIRSESDNRVRGAIAQLRGLGDTPLKASLLRVADRYSPVFARAIRDEFPEFAQGRAITDIQFWGNDPAMN